MSFLVELRRRNVFKVGAAYAVMVWLLIQVADIILPIFKAPEWVSQTLTFVLILGFPVAVILAWAYELTPEGIKLEKDVVRSESITHFTGRKLDFSIIALLAIALIVVMFDNYAWIDADPLDGLVDVSEPVPGFSNRAAIAVLPFLNLSGDPADEYFSDGITEDIITALQSIGIFPVIARTSTFSYKGRAMDVREIATELGAGYVLEGSVRRGKDQIRVTVQLNNASGRHVWAKNYDSEISEVFAVQDEIIHQIIGAIEPELMQAEISRASRVRPEDMEAWDYYLQAAAIAPTWGGYVNRTGQLMTIENLEQALELLQKAIELDPSFADAYTLLGHTNAAYGVWQSAQVSDDIFEKIIRDAFEYVRRGRELSPFSATTCSCYAYFLAGGGLPEMRDLAAALEIQEDAVRMNPANALARAVLGKVYQVLGRYDEALLETRIAKRLSPKDVDLSYFLTVEAAAHLGLGDWESAADVAKSAILLTPLNFSGHAIRIAALYAPGDTDGAASALEFMENSVPNFSVKMLFDAPLSESLAASISPRLNLQDEPRYRQAMAAILEDLGWSTDL